MVFPCRKRLLFQIKRTAGNTNEQSFTCSALLCSALLCSAVSIWRLFQPCQPLFTSFFKILGKAKPQLYRRKAAIPTREISRRFPADKLQLADPMGPCSFAPPACAGFADSIYRCVQYTILPQNCKRKAAIFIANCSKFLQILHRKGIYRFRAKQMGRFPGKLYLQDRTHREAITQAIKTAANCFEVIAVIAKRPTPTNVSVGLHYPIMRLNFWRKWRKFGVNPLLRVQKIKQFQGFAVSLSTCRPCRPCRREPRVREARACRQPAPR